MLATDTPLAAASAWTVRWAEPADAAVEAGEEFERRTGTKR